jgi:hypothetical protein
MSLLEEMLEPVDGDKGSPIAGLPFFVYQPIGGTSNYF